MKVTGTTEQHGVVHRAIYMTQGLNNVRTACGGYTLVRAMHTRPKAITCLYCLMHKGDD